MFLTHLVKFEKNAQMRIYFRGVIWVDYIFITDFHNEMFMIMVDSK